MGYLRQDLQDLTDASYVISDADADADPTGQWLFEDVTVGETSTGGTDWKLTTCCGTDEIIFLCLLFAYLVIIYFLWNTGNTTNIVPASFNQKYYTLLFLILNFCIHAIKLLNITYLLLISGHEAHEINCSFRAW